MKILITDEGKYLLESKTAPVIGRRYTLEDAETGTAAQNKAAHALMQEYFKSGCFSDNASTWLELRDRLKIRLGQGFEAFIYVHNEHPHEICDAKKYEDIPKAIRSNPDYKNYIRGRLKSWSDYKLSERKIFLDNLIAEMHNAGVQSKKFMEILDGMEAKNDR